MFQPASRREGEKPKAALRPFSLIGVTVLVFLGSYFAYRYFRVADAEGWLFDVGLTFLLVALAIGAAAAAAAFYIALKRRRKRDAFLSDEK